MPQEEVTMMLSVVPGVTTGISTLMGGMVSLNNVFMDMTRQIDASFGLIDTSIVTTATVVAQLGFKAAEAFGQFEQGMKIAQMVSGQTLDSMNQLKQAANELSVEYRTDIDQITEGLQTLGRAGLNSATEQTEVLREGLSTAKLESRDLNGVLEELIQNTALLGGNLKSDQFGENSRYVNDLLVATSMTAPITTHDVSETLKYSGGIAAAAGARIDSDEGKRILEDYMGAIAAFAQKGVTGSIAGTALRAFFNKPATQDSSVTEALASIKLKPEYLWEEDEETMKPVSEQINIIQKQMDKLDVSTMDRLQIWSKIVGGKMGQQMMKLDSTSIKELTRDIREANSAEDLASGTFKTFQANMKEMSEQGQVAFRNFGQNAAIAINPIIQVITKLLELLSNPIASLGLFAGFAGLIGNAASRVKNIFGKLKTEFSTILDYFHRGEELYTKRPSIDRTFQRRQYGEGGGYVDKDEKFHYNYYGSSSIERQVRDKIEFTKQQELLKKGVTPEQMYILKGLNSKDFSQGFSPYIYDTLNSEEIGNLQDKFSRMSPDILKAITGRQGFRLTDRDIIRYAIENGLWKESYDEMFINVGGNLNEVMKNISGELYTSVIDNIFNQYKNERTNSGKSIAKVVSLEAKSRMKGLKRLFGLRLTATDTESLEKSKRFEEVIRNYNGGDILKNGLLEGDISSLMSIFADDPYLRTIQVPRNHMQFTKRVNEKAFNKLVNQGISSSLAEILSKESSFGKVDSYDYLVSTGTINPMELPKEEWLRDLEESKKDSYAGNLQRVYKELYKEIMADPALFLSSTAGEFFSLEENKDLPSKLGIEKEDSQFFRDLQQMFILDKKLSKKDVRELQASVIKAHLEPNELSYYDFEGEPVYDSNDEFQNQERKVFRDSVTIPDYPSDYLVGKRIIGKMTDEELYAYTMNKYGGLNKASFAKGPDGVPIKAIIPDAYLFKNNQFSPGYDDFKTFKVSGTDKTVEEFFQGDNKKIKRAFETFFLPNLQRGRGNLSDRLKREKEDLQKISDSSMISPGEFDTNKIFGEFDSSKQSMYSYMGMLGLPGRTKLKGKGIDISKQKKAITDYLTEELEHNPQNVLRNLDIDKMSESFFAKNSKWNRTQIQNLAKAFGIKANLSNQQIFEELRMLQADSSNIYTQTSFLKKFGITQEEYTNFQQNQEAFLEQKKRLEAEAAATREAQRREQIAKQLSHEFRKMVAAVQTGFFALDSDKVTEQIAGDRGRMFNKEVSEAIAQSVLEDSFPRDDFARYWKGEQYDRDRERWGARHSPEPNPDLRNERLEYDKEMSKENAKKFLHDKSNDIPPYVQEYLKEKEIMKQIQGSKGALNNAIKKADESYIKELIKGYKISHPIEAFGKDDDSLREEAMKEFAERSKNSYNAKHGRKDDNYSAKELRENLYTLPMVLPKQVDFENKTDDQLKRQKDMVEENFKKHEGLHQKTLKETMSGLIKNPFSGWGTKLGDSLLTRNHNSLLGTMGDRKSLTAGQQLKNLFANGIDLMGGPWMVAMEGATIAIQLFQQAQQAYVQKIQELTENVNESLDKQNEAEEIFLKGQHEEGKREFKGWEEDHPDATAEEREQALLDAYSQLYDNQGKPLVELDENTQQLAIATEELKRTNEQLGNAYLDEGFFSGNGLWQEFEDSLANSANFLDYTINELGNVGQVLLGGSPLLVGAEVISFGKFGSGQGYVDKYGNENTSYGKSYFDNGEFLKSGWQEKEEYPWAKEMAALFAADVWKEGSTDNGLKVLLGDAGLKSLNDMLGSTGGKGNSAWTTHGANINEYFNTVEDQNKLQMALKNHGQQFSKLAKQTRRFEKATGSTALGALNKQYKKEGATMKGMKKALNNLSVQDPKLVSYIKSLAIETGMSEQQVLMAAQLQQLQDMNEIANNQVTPQLMSLVGSTFQQVAYSGQITGQVGGAGAGAVSAAQNAAAIAALLQVKVESELGKQMKQEYESRLDTPGQGKYSGYTDDQFRALIIKNKQKQLEGQPYEEYLLDYYDLYVKTYAGVNTQIYSPNATPDYIDKKSQEFLDYTKKNGSSVNAVNDTLRTGLKAGTAKQILDAYDASLNDQEGGGSSGGGGSGSGDKDKDKDQGTKKERVDLVLCNKKEIPKLNVNLFKKPPTFTVLNKNFKLRDVKINTEDKPKAIMASIKNAFIDVQKRSDPKIIQDEEAEYDPVGATDGNALPSGSSKPKTNNNS